MRDSLSLADMLDALKAMQQAERMATYVYKRCDWRLEYDSCVCAVVLLLLQDVILLQGMGVGRESQSTLLRQDVLLLHTAAVAAYCSTAPLIRHNL
jgi:hypothetical protein